MTTTATPREADRDHAGRDRLAMVSAALGVVAALLTTTLSFISLATGLLAIVLGAVVLRRSGNDAMAVVGTVAAAVSVYVILLEILVIG